MSDPQARFDDVRRRIDGACASVGRQPESVTLVAVSKTYSAERILELYQLGQRHFGESRLQEALPKMEALPDDIVWHFIGRLQSNKAKAVANAFAAIHTLDSTAQLREVSKAGGKVDGLIEVNVGEEAQKGGISVNLLDEFVANVLQCPNVCFKGLMTIGPPEQSPAETRSMFATMRRLNERVGGEWLSLGMSGDYEIAIQEGSTHVRVGSALFGAR